MNLAQSIRTTNKSMYEKWVLNTSEYNKDEVKNLLAFPFDIGYELFALGLLLGFANDYQADAEKSDFGDPIYQVNDISKEHFKATIETIYVIIQLSEDVDSDDEAWIEALKYADGGIELLDEQDDTNIDFDEIGEEESEEGGMNGEDELHYELIERINMVSIFEENLEKLDRQIEQIEEEYGDEEEELPGTVEVGFDV